MGNAPGPAAGETMTATPAGNGTFISACSANPVQMPLTEPLPVTLTAVVLDTAAPSLSVTVTVTL